MIRRWGPLTGIAFLALFIGAFIVAGDPPDFDAPPDEVASFYSENDGEVVAGSILFALAAVFLLFFAGSVRATLRPAEGGSGFLSAVAFGGGIVATTGFLILAGLGFSLADVGDDVEVDPVALQALNVLNEDLFFPAAGGVLTFLVASGIAILRTGVLPAWLGVVALLSGVLAMSPLFFIAGPLAGLWIVIVSFLLATRDEAPAATGAPPPAPPPV